MPIYILRYSTFKLESCEHLRSWCIYYYIIYICNMYIVHSLKSKWIVVWFRFDFLWGFRRFNHGHKRLVRRYILYSRAFQIRVRRFVILILSRPFSDVLQIGRHDHIQATTHSRDYIIYILNHRSDTTS